MFSSFEKPPIHCVASQRESPEWGFFSMIEIHIIMSIIVEAVVMWANAKRLSKEVLESHKLFNAHGISIAFLLYFFPFLCFHSVFMTFLIVPE